MKHLKQFEKYKATKALSNILNEAVMQVDDVSKVRAVADIPQSLLNNVVKKCKDASGKNIRQFYSDNDIAEEIVKHVFNTYLNLDHISTVPFVGGEEVPQAQPQAQPQSQPQAQPQAQPQVQIEPQDQSQTEPQAQIQIESPEVESPEDEDSEFEEIDEPTDDSEEDNEELPI